VAEERETRKKFIAREMFTTEKSYLESLQVGHKNYQLVLVPKVFLDSISCFYLIF
jgi:hypothetical protein